MIDKYWPQYKHIGEKKNIEAFMLDLETVLSNILTNTEVRGLSIIYIKMTRGVHIIPFQFCAKIITNSVTAKTGSIG